MECCKEDQCEEGYEEGQRAALSSEEQENATKKTSCVRRLQEVECEESPKSILSSAGIFLAICVIVSLEDLLNQ